MEQILTGFSAMALMACLFVVLYLLVGIEEKSPRKTWIIVLILAVFLRIGKSFFYFLFPNISSYGVASGFVGYAFIGPLLLFYFQTPGKRSWLPHIIFPVIGALGIILYPTYARPFYALCSVSFAFYLVLIFYYKKTKDLRINAWDQRLLATLAGLSLVFIVQIFLPTLQLYVIGTGAASLLISIWFVYLLKNPLELKSQVKEKKTRLDESQIQKVKQVLLREKYYRNSDVTLQSFSSKLEIPTYLISAIVKQEFSRSFPKTINYLRVEEIKSTLQKPESVHLKVELLGYDVGFSSPSSFYAAFKKETGESPRMYQKNNSLVQE